jgi:hypothetical protein
VRLLKNKFDSQEGLKTKPIIKNSHGKFSRIQKKTEKRKPTVLA